MTPEKLNAGAEGVFCWAGAAAGARVESVFGGPPPAPDVELCAASGPATSNAMNASDLRGTMHMDDRIDGATVVTKVAPCSSAVCNNILGRGHDRNAGIVAIA